MRLARWGWTIAALAAVCAAPFVAGARARRDRVVTRTTSESGRQEITLLSKAHRIDRLFGSMQGPFSRQRGIRLSPGEGQRLVWITGVRADVVSADGSSPAPPRFFCHANLVAEQDSDRDATRLVTLVPGRMSIQLPRGFGIPVAADDALEYFSMSLNLDEPTGSRDIRFRTKISFLRDSEARAAAMRPLALRAVYGYEPLTAAGTAPLCTGGSSPGAACGPFFSGAASRNAFIDSLGRTNTVHWFIPPGRYDRSVPVDVQLNLRHDVTVHFVTAHLHPGGRSVALVDATAGQTVFEIHAGRATDRGGISRMGEIAIPSGVSLRRGHRYELRTVYENGSGAPIDAMSILYLYCLDEPGPAEA